VVFKQKGGLEFVDLSDLKKSRDIRCFGNQSEDEANDNQLGGLELYLSYFRINRVQI
jgi:hypothetical protein